MIPSPDTPKENLDELLLETEMADLEAFCKAQGFTKEETDRFVRNTLEMEKTREEADLTRIIEG